MTDRPSDVVVVGGGPAGLRFPVIAPVLAVAGMVYGEQAAGFEVKTAISR